MAQYWNMDTKMWLPAQMKAFVKGLPPAMTSAHALVRRVARPTLLTEAQGASPLPGWYLTQGYVIDISLCGGTIEKLAADLFDSGEVELVSLTVRYTTGSVTMNVSDREVCVVGDVTLPMLPEGMLVAKLTVLERM